MADPFTLRRSYKFLLRPTGQQKGALLRMLEDHRELYNAALEERRQAWRRARVSISFYDQDRQLKEIRRLRPELAVWAFVSEREAIRRLDRAFKAFYRRCKAGQAPGFPRFRGRERFDSVTWPEHGSGCRWLPSDGAHPSLAATATSEKPRKRRSHVYLMGVGQVRVHAHRPVRAG